MPHSIPILLISRRRLDDAQKSCVRLCNGNYLSDRLRRRSAHVGSQDLSTSDTGRRLPGGSVLAEAAAESLGVRLSSWSFRRFPRSCLGRTPWEGVNGPRSWCHDGLSAGCTSLW